MSDNHKWFRLLDEAGSGALDRSPAEQDASLREACGGDDQLRAQLEAALPNLPRAEAFLEQPLVAIAAEVLDLPDERVMVGSRINSLEIGALLGAGGMGEVYRARDTELNRDVAVKILPPEFANEPDWLARFGREARVLASLNHPNIAHIHGLQTTEDVTAIVMELVEGETLADRLTRGPIGLRDALPIARQIAEGLEAAHEHGVVHRDLKPANIRVRSDGTVKLVDFGLATTVAPANAEADEPPDVSALSSIPGMVLGTAAYMAPEQATQKPVDRRADLWALGCVIFEMLTGRPAFSGTTPSEVLLAVTEHEPHWDALPASTPPGIRRLIRRCLQKDVRNRLDSAAVARLEIDDAVATPPPVELGRGAGRWHRFAWAPPFWLSIGALSAVLVTLALIDRERVEQPRPLTVTSFTATQLNLGQPGVHFSVATTGRTIVFTSANDGHPVIFRRDVDGLDSVPVVQICCPSDMFFAEDGRRFGFETRSELWSGTLDGDTPKRLQPNHALRGGTWGSGDRIVVGRVGSGLWMTSASGGASRQLTVPEGGVRHELPQLLPGGHAVLFTILPADKPSRAAVVMLDTGEVRDLFEGTGARYADSGHVVFGRGDKLWAVGFDLRTLQTSGAPQPVREDVLWSSSGYPQFTLGGHTLAYARRNPTSTALGKGRISVVDRQGQVEVLPLKPDHYLLGALSPQGDRFVVQVGASLGLWIFDFARSTFGPLTSGRVLAYSAPMWTPDGEHVVFTTWFDGEVSLGSVAADGSGSVEALVKGQGMRSYERTHPTYLPDGSGVIMTGLSPGASVEELLLVRLKGEPGLETLLRGPSIARNPAIAPDGRFLAYNSDESGRPEVYVRPFPDVRAWRRQISTDGGSAPRWTRGGREIVYRDGRGRIMSVAVRDGPGGFERARPELLFAFGAGNCCGAGLDRGYDVSADGERFVFFGSPVTAPSESLAELVLIQNWVDELKRLVPPTP